MDFMAGFREVVYEMGGRAFVLPSASRLQRTRRRRRVDGLDDPSLRKNRDRTPWILLLGAILVMPWSDAGAQRNTLRHDGIDRSYVVRVPLEVERRKARVPLVIVMHGGGGNAQNTERMTFFTEKATKEGFIVVYPEGTSRGGQLLTWNAGHCCGYAMKNRVDDVGFIDALITRLAANHPVDTSRVYATGMSNGGMMAHRLGLELSRRVKAIAPVVATVFGDEKRPPNAVRALMINGMLDQAVPPRGGKPGGRFQGAWDGTSARPALAQATFWAEANGCTGDPEKHETKEFTHVQHRCPAGRAVELYLIRDNGHAWPGGRVGSRLGDRPSTALNATDAIWDFFTRD
jgi:polyhydroxybutyrate depolymerase